MLFEELVHVLDPLPHSGAVNMAVDELLLLTALRPSLRFYRWTRPSVSFGYFGRLEEVERLWPACEPVRRWTGGGIVPHESDLTYTLVVPIEHPFARLAPGESYRRIHEIVASVLAASTRPVRLASDDERTASQECFRKAVTHDVVEGGRKVAGAAQRRTRRGLIHQGSIQMTGLAADFPSALARHLGGESLTREITAMEIQEAEALAARKYGTEAWLRRR